MLNKYASGMHWMNGFAYATQGLLQLLLTILTFVTLFAALIFGLRDAGRYLPQMNPAVGIEPTTNCLTLIKWAFLFSAHYALQH